MSEDAKPYDAGAEDPPGSPLIIHIERRPVTRKDYLGDGVYVGFDGHGLVLTTEDGVATTNEIYLEPEVYHGLLGYVAQIKASNKPEPA